MTNLEKKLQQIQNTILGQINQISDISKLGEFKTSVLGKRGELAELLKEIPKLPANDRAAFGKKVNQVKNNLEKIFNQKVSSLPSQPSAIFSPLDPTFPGIKLNLGHLHPITQVSKRAVSIFQKMGFEVWEARLVDDKYHNYLSLNFPDGHPAMDIMDTLWVNDNLLPITHTSSMQNRVLRTSQPPIAAIVLGPCFRKEATDPTHEHTFYQLEGVFVDQKVSLADLIGTLKSFLETFFERELKIKVQPSYFPFVEPGIEIMVEWGKGWIELIPAGMIHPNVLKEGGVDSEKYTGFAWAIGLDRLTMLTYGINDIRWFHSGDLRFLGQF